MLEAIWHGILLISLTILMVGGIIWSIEHWNG